MQKFLFSILLSVFIFPLMVLDVHADKEKIVVNCLCKEANYPLYGETEIYVQGGTPPTCYVMADLELMSQKEIEKEIEKEAAEAAKKNQEKPPFATLYGEGLSNIGAAFSQSGSGIFKSVSSTLTALYSQLPSKKELLTLMPQLIEKQFLPYHAFLDQEVFGTAIQNISEKKTAADLEKYLKGFEDKKGCSKDNPKPLCVAEFAMCNYEKYTKIIFAQAGRTLTQKSLASSGGNVDVLLKVIQRRDQSLLGEANHAQEALDTALALYSQFYNTYLIHLKFKETIESLVQARKLTGVFRTLVECIPNKFVGVATTKCN